MHLDSVVTEAIMAALPHDGIGTRSDWLRAGASERMFSDGRLRRIARGLYVAAGDDRPLTAARMATLLPADAVVGGWAAAMAHGVRDAGPTMVSGQPDDVLVYPGRQMHTKLPGFRTLRSDLADGDVTMVDGVPMTTPLRTAYDMARFAPTLLTAVGLLDCFRYQLNADPVSGAALEAVIIEHPRARGNSRIRRALTMSSPRSRSIPESWLRARLVLEGATDSRLLMVNASLLHGGDTFELDLVDVNCGLVLEYDSKFHTDAAQRGRDSRKDVAVDEAGLLMLRVNSPLLATPRELASTVTARRATAMARGSQSRAAELVATRRLAELRLRP